VWHDARLSGLRWCLRASLAGGQAMTAPTTDLSPELPPGQQVPSEAERAQARQMSRGAVRAAVRLLRERELVYTIQARGTFVIDRSPPPAQGG
jgi:hypothetical protein